MEKEDRERLVRVEEGIKSIKSTLVPLVARVQKHEKSISNYHSDRRWIAGLFGIVATFIATNYHDLIAWLKRTLSG